MTKIFGDINTGNYIEVKNKISLLGRRNFSNATRASMSMGDNSVGYKMIAPEQDPDIILLRACLISITTDNETISKNISLSDIDRSQENIDNIEEAIEHLKRVNRLGAYAGIEFLEVEELETRKKEINKNLDLINELIEKKGN
ncbi:MAG: hypothetical protein ACRC5G_03180 [Cetobacterium sp.]